VLTHDQSRYVEFGLNCVSPVESDFGQPSTEFNFIFFK
jgi:hypothetical protein